MELTAPGVNKGTGALWLCNHLDADPNYCMSIGDSNNDLTMLKAIGFSYAMDNSPKSVKEVAKYYTSDVMQNGLGEAIQDYIFRTKFDILRQANEDKLEKQKLKKLKTHSIVPKHKKNNCNFTIDHLGCFIGLNGRFFK